MQELSLARATGHEPWSRDAGYTLTELLVVLSLMTLLAGLSAGAFLAVHRTYSLSASASEIQTILRAARNASISTGTGSLVVIDPVAREVRAQSFEAIEEWSFEPVGSDEGPDAGAGARGPSLDLHGGEPVAGRLGMGVRFRQGGYVDCGTDPAYDVTEAVVLEAWVRHELVREIPPPASESDARRPRLVRRRGREAGGAVYPIIWKGNAYFLGLTAAGALEGAIGDYRAVTEDDVVPPERWVFVSLRYDGRALELVADGVARITYPAGTRNQTLPEEIPVSGSPLEISSPEAPFPGRIDEVRIRGRKESLVYRHPPAQRVIGWKKEVRFDRRGHLDPAYHDGDVRIVLAELSDEQYERAVRMEVKGAIEGVDPFELTFDEWLAAWPAAEAAALDQRQEERGIEERIYAEVPKRVLVLDRLGVVR